MTWNFLSFTITNFSQLIYISLIKLRSALSTLFWLEGSIFHGGKVKKKVTDKVRKKCTKKCAKSSFILQILMSIKTRFSCFISLLFHYQWNASIFSSLATFLKFSTILFYCIRTNWKCNNKVQYVCCALTCCVALFLGRS